MPKAAATSSLLPKSKANSKNNLGTSDNVNSSSARHGEVTSASTTATGKSRATTGRIAGTAASGKSLPESPETGVGRLTQMLTGEFASSREALRDQSEEGSQQTTRPGTQSGLGGSNAVLDTVEQPLLPPQPTQRDLELEQLKQRAEHLPKPLETLKSSLSVLGWAPGSLKQIYLKFSLINRDLKDIDFLKSFLNLETLELSGNQIEDISVLNNLNHVTRIDLFDNELNGPMALTNPPRNLQEVDLGRNGICEMGDWSPYQFLNCLCMNENLISEIENLQFCRHLKFLSLSNNKIERITNLDNLPIVFLDLSNNCIEDISGLGTLTELQEVRLSNNKIKDIDYFKSRGEIHQNLKILDLSYNAIVDTEAGRLLQSLAALENLNLSNNPIASEETYRLMLIYDLQHLMILDSIAISAEEKVSAVNLLHPPLEIVECLKHASKLQDEIRVYAKIESQMEIQRQPCCT